MTGTIHSRVPIWKTSFTWVDGFFVPAFVHDFAVWFYFFSLHILLLLLLRTKMSIICLNTFCWCLCQRVTFHAPWSFFGEGAQLGGWYLDTQMLGFVGWFFLYLLNFSLYFLNTFSQVIRCLFNAKIKTNTFRNQKLLAFER